MNEEKRLRRKQLHIAKLETIYKLIGVLQGIDPKSDPEAENNLELQKSMLGGIARYLFEFILSEKEKDLLYFSGSSLSNLRKSCKGINDCNTFDLAEDMMKVLIKK